MAPLKLDDDGFASSKTTFTSHLERVFFFHLHLLDWSMRGKSLSEVETSSKATRWAIILFRMAHLGLTVSSGVIRAHTLPLAQAATLGRHRRSVV